MNDTTIIQRGTRVHCILAHAGEGVVTAVREDPNARNTYVIGLPGLERVRSTGQHLYDVVFLNGHFSQGVPETIFRGVQWHILERLAEEEEIARLVAAHLQLRAEDEAAAERRRFAFEVERDQLKADPANKHLTQGDDQSSGLLAAKNIRAVLRRAFPGERFSVQKRSWGTVSIQWEDGPTEEQVRGLVDRFRSGSFDGMQDQYVSEKTPWNAVFGGTKYLNLTRFHSPALITRAIAEVMAQLGDIGVGVSTAEDYAAGKLWDIEVPGAHGLESLIRMRASRLAG
ncbi:hypothetical protein E9232_006849 [Inquilinus ginsengisoli]|uniref:Large polyvalent protein associated domain-containing protein n=1 Tax=Inquilinus ginsengisoli TaxID=363840 RepID=A0ABU1K091_9PROT|nr:LPD29 domain-containing protein [Inquilinus ginsengisoli]MDR6294295.1 hypothetical protein [Inquilinus ginsengisoli]